jgi:hypothetical protein
MTANNYWDDIGVPEPVEPEDIVESVWMALWMKYPVIMPEDRDNGDEN